ncbi:MAG: hypothetical protein HYR96_06585 [Deltaproteobacteria bacterium]|nr:hypothetical protein [Deltaproteobacteria bacterium]MBI3295737.1 hypothetical protein [Deltaproteobacteria bacterium]
MKTLAALISITFVTSLWAEDPYTEVLYARVDGKLINKILIGQFSKDDFLPRAWADPKGIYPTYAERIVSLKKAIAAGPLPPSLRFQISRALDEVLKAYERSTQSLADEVEVTDKSLEEALKDRTLPVARLQKLKSYRAFIELLRQELKRGADLSLPSSLPFETFASTPLADVGAYAAFFCQSVLASDLKRIQKGETPFLPMTGPSAVVHDRGGVVSGPKRLIPVHAGSTPPGAYGSPPIVPGFYGPFNDQSRIMERSLGAVPRYEQSPRASSPTAPAWR